MKLRTTSTGWLFLTGFIVFTVAALTINGFGSHYEFYPQQGLVSRAQGLAQAAQARSPAGLAAIAASMMTSGQRVGVLFALLLGVVIVTSEFANQTAAVTFVTVPRRTTVITARWPPRPAAESFSGWWARSGPRWPRRCSCTPSTSARH